VGAIGHNFNNLLLPILGHTELLTLEVPATSPAHEHVQAVVDSVRAASEHCRELLLCAATGSYAGKPLHLSELIDDMGKLIRSLATKRSRLKFHLNGSLPFIFGDPNQIQQLLLCSVSNALESISGKNGAITLSTSARFIDRASLDATFLGRGLPEGTYVVLEIRDTGCGMDQETQDHLFEPFFSTKFGSSGLGMAMVMGIMRRHDGAIELHSQPGQGTVIRYLFPAAGESQEHIQLVDEKRTAEELHPQGAILLVDDEEPILRVSKMMLEKLGYAVITAKGGLEALDVFFNRRSEVVCIVLDITMPDLDGEAVYQAIRREDSSIPIILSSGYSEKGVADRFAGKAIAGFLPKPYGIAELREAILHALKWRR
jgi:CheY-like chemotaxis protein